MEKLNPSNEQPLEPLERTKTGKIGLGVLLILVGIGTSAIIIGIPILLMGCWLIYEAFKERIRQ